MGKIRGIESNEDSKGSVLFKEHREFKIRNDFVTPTQKTPFSIWKISLPKVCYKKHRKNENLVK